MTRVLYIAVGNPLKPSVGMDLIVSEHLKELAGVTDLDVSAIFVAPGVAEQGNAGFSMVGRLSVGAYIGDLLCEKPGIARTISKIMFVLCRAVPVMAYSFKSKVAAEEIKKLLLVSNFDVVVVEHFYALSNINLRDLRQSGARIIYISHNSMLPHIAEMAAARTTLASKIYYAVEAVRSYFVERYLFRLSATVVHLSEYERSRVKCGKGKHVALLPPVSNVAGLVAGASAHSIMAQSVIFIGSPNHPPNAHAIQWLVEKLAPALAKKAPHIQIALLGDGTERIQAPSGNVKGYGFVSPADMRQALSTCICAVSSVVLGRGIKVKVLDAIAAGCPVFATEQSLRGFERFGLPVSIFLEHPERLATAILELAESESEREVARIHMRRLWADFLAQRRGQFAQVIRGISY